jgi:hypothetical protein
MTLRAGVYASLPLALLGTDAAPGCGCTVSHCCTEAYSNSQDLSLAHLFNVSRYGSHGKSMMGRNSSGYSAACSLLNLVPGIFDQDSGGACSDLAFSMGDTTVCEAINASAEERMILVAEKRAILDPFGRGLIEPFSILSAFLEPGTCAELQDGACWESREGNATYSWDGAVTVQDSRWCAVQALVGDARLQWSVTCPQEGGLKVQAKWLDDDSTNNWLADDWPNNWHCPTDGSGNYSDGVEATLGVDDWLGGEVGGYPRWQCFDLPGGPSDYRYLMYSVGELPCNGGNGGPPLSSGSSSTSLAALAHAAAAAVVVGAMA